jgi:hypothetical protein
MKLSKNKKILVGLLTLWPILYMFIFMALMVSTMAIAMRTHQQEPPKIFFIMFALHFFTIIYMFCLIGFYVYYIFKTDRVAKDKKALWAVVIFLGNMFAMPVFWFWYIWKEPKINNS